MSFSENQNEISLTMVVDKNEDKVLYAEAGKDFVDVLLSFLTLPLGAVSTLVSEDSTVQPCRFNCITSLRRSVEKLDPKYFSAKEDKKMLLNPRSPMDDYYKNIGYHHYDNTPFSKGFKGYLRETTCYIVSDDLRVIPSEVDTAFWMLRSFRADCVTEKLTVSVTQKVVLDLLKFSLWSKTPFADLFLGKKLPNQTVKDFIDRFIFIHNSKPKLSEAQDKVGTRMKLKVVKPKYGIKVLFSLAEEDFTDQLLSFLTIPVAAVERLGQGNSGFGCIDNLYKSSSDLDAFRVYDPTACMFDLLKDKLLNPLIVPSKVKNQVLPIYALGSSSRNTSGYVKWGTKFMVKDDLSVEPFSSRAALSFLVESKVAEQDLEVIDLSIVVNEVFEILKAAMLSNSALTIGLSPLLTLVKEEK